MTDTGISLTCDYCNGCSEKVHLLGGPFNYQTKACIHCRFNDRRIHSHVRLAEITEAMEADAQLVPTKPIFHYFDQCKPTTACQGIRQ